MTACTLRPIGFVRSDLKDRRDAPRHGREGAPQAWLEIDPAFAPALDGLRPGQDIIVLTWLHLGRREVLRVVPRHDPANPERGVFATRSPDRPNPVGLHRVRLFDIDGTRLHVGPLEAIDGTPVLDIKNVLDGLADG
jgi:tRNA-Thr(GGU) m(6)t(6)A37 methyltransferase TsaA